VTTETASLLDVFFSVYNAWMYSFYFLYWSRERAVCIMLPVVTGVKGDMVIVMVTVYGLRGTVKSGRVAAPRELQTVEEKKRSKHQRWLRR
jgi:hypothetical protein